jgi:hypothetical protein
MRVGRQEADMRKGMWVAGAVMACVVAVSGPLAAADKREEAAQESALAWLALVDAGQYDESWEKAAPLFKQALTKDKWREALGAARQPLGKLVSRKLMSSSYTEHLPGAPDGRYVVLQYETVFEHKAQAVETITPAADASGTWRVSGYYIK